MKKLLYLTHSAGYRHDVLGYSHEVMQRLAKQCDAFDVTSADDVNDVDWDSIAQYDAFAFCTTGELPITDAAKDTLIELIKKGKGFVGIHNATDTFYKYPAYGEMIGGYFNGHPWHQEVGVIVEDHNHPSTRELPDRFEIHDEIYVQRNWSRDKTHVLMHLDNSTVDLEKAKGVRDDTDFALAWWHIYGQGRVFYTALGHGEPTWSSDLFHKHLVGGIRWSIGEA